MKSFVDNVVKRKLEALFVKRETCMIHPETLYLCRSSYSFMEKFSLRQIEKKFNFSDLNFIFFLEQIEHKFSKKRNKKFKLRIYFSASRNLFDSTCRCVDTRIYVYKEIELRF